MLNSKVIKRVKSTASLFGQLGVLGLKPSLEETCTQQWDL